MQREFDDLAMSMASGQSRRGTLKQLLLGAIGIPAVTLGGLGLSEVEAKNKKKKNKGKNKKVTLCHNGQTITVAQKAKKKHLKHGDTLGPCQNTPATQCQTAADCSNPITTCQERTCTNGVCDVRSLSAGTACDDGNACTTGTTCDSQGSCGGGTSVSCNNPPSECQTANGATCDPNTGQCSYPAKPNNTPCSANPCNSTCQNGQCVGTPVTCEQPLNECQVVVCDPSNGTCGAPVAANQGEACNAGAGMCVNGACEETNTGINTCTGVNPCNLPTFCNAAETCLCYSTIEGAGFCIDKNQAQCPGTDVRPACASSDECSDSEVCVPLKETPDSTTSCCGNGAQFPGFCVPLSARCAQGA